MGYRSDSIAISRDMGPLSKSMWVTFWPSFPKMRHGNLLGRGPKHHQGILFKKHFESISSENSKTQSSQNTVHVETVTDKGRSNQFYEKLLSDRFHEFVLQEEQHLKITKNNSLFQTGPILQ